MPTSDQSGFDRAPPDFTKQADFDAASMQLASDVAERMAQNVRSVAEATSVMSKGLKTMSQMSQSAAENGLSLDGVLDKQRALVLKVSEAVSKSNLSFGDQARVQKVLIGSVESYARQMGRILVQKREDLKATQRGTEAYRKQKVALDRVTVSVENQKKSLMELVKTQQRRAQRAGTVKKIKDWVFNTGNRSDAFSKDTSGLLGKFNSEAEQIKKSILHTSGAWKGNGWGTIEAGSIVKDWKTVGATIGVVAATGAKALGDFAQHYEHGAIALAQYKNNIEQVARSMGMINAKPLEILRSSFSLTRDSALQLFQTISQGMAETGKSSAELSSVAKTLKETFGGDITAQLKSYIDLIKTIPTLKEDLTTGTEVDKTASLYALATSGKANDLNALMPTGLFGGEQKRQPGADKLDAAQSAAARTEKLGDFLMNLMPSWSSYFAEIPIVVSSISAFSRMTSTLVGGLKAAAMIAWKQKAAQDAASDVKTTSQIAGFNASNTSENIGIINAIVASSAGNTIKRGLNPSMGGGLGGPARARIKVPGLPNGAAPSPTSASAPSAIGGGGVGGGGLAAGSAGAMAVGGALIAVGAAGIALSKYEANQKHNKAERQIEEGDFTGAKATLESSGKWNKGGTAAGGALAGAGVGMMAGGPIGAAIGAAIGGVAGYIQGVAESSAQNQKLLAEIAKYEKQNLEEFGSVIIPATKGKADYDKLRAQSTEVLNGRAKNLARSAKVLQDALGELQNGVNSAKLQFFSLQQDLGKLKFQQADLLGLNSDSVKNAIGMQLGGARGAYDTKMRAVERARNRVANDKGLDPEARAALSARTEKEAASALLEFVRATMEAAEAIRKLPEFLMNSMNVESLTDIFENGIVDEKSIGAMWDSSMAAWEKSLDETRQVFDAKRQALKKSTELGQADAATSIAKVAASVQNIQRPTNPFFSKEDKEAAIVTRQRLILENAIKKKRSGGELAQQLSAEEQAAYDKYSEDGAWGTWVLRQMPDIFTSGSRQNEIDDNNEIIATIDKQLFEDGAGGNSARAQYEFAQKYGSRFQDLITTDENGKQMLDVGKASTLRDDIQKELDQARGELENMSGGQDMLNIREIENNRKQQRRLGKQAEKDRREGNIEGAEEAERQINNLKSELTGELIPSLNNLFSGVGLNDSQQKKATDYIANNGFDRFLLALEAGKTQELFGVQDGSEIANGIINVLKSNIGGLKDADKAAARVSELSGKVDRLNSAIEASEEREKGMLDLQRQEMMEVRKSNAEQIKKLSLMAKGIGENTAELRHLVEVTQNRLTAAQATGSGVEAYSNAWGAMLDEMTASNAAAAEAIAKGPEMVENLKSQVTDAETKRDKSKDVLDQLNKEFSDKYGGRKLNEGEVKEAEKLQKKIQIASAAYTMNESQVAALKKQELEAQKTITDGSKTLAENAKKASDYIGEVDRIISAGMESAQGKVIKALSEESESVWDASDFATDIKSAAREARDIGIAAAERKAEMEREELEKAAAKVEQMANAAADAAKKFAYADKKEQLKKLNPNLSDQEIEAQASAYAEEEAAKASGLVKEQAVHKLRAAGLKTETNLKRERLKQLETEKQKNLAIKDIQLSAVDAYRDFAENYGGSFSEVLQLQNISVQLEHEKLDIMKQELEEAKAAGASGKELLERQQQVFMQEIAVRKKEIGVAKSMMDRMLGAAFGQIRQSFGARVQMGTAQHLMGTENTRIKRADGTYMEGNPKTIEQRQFERQVNGAFGTSSASSANLAANVMQDSSKIFKDSTDIFAGAVSQLNEMINGMFNPSTDRNAETGLWLKAFINSLPHHAGGTNNTKKGPMVVGENGPEIVISSGGDTVIPHSAIGSLPHYASGTHRSKKGPVVVGENGTEIVVPSEASINSSIKRIADLKNNISNLEITMEDEAWARTKELTDDNYSRGINILDFFHGRRFNSNGIETQFSKDSNYWHDETEKLNSEIAKYKNANKIVPQHLKDRQQYMQDLVDLHKNWGYTKLGAALKRNDQEEQLNTWKKELNELQSKSGISGNVFQKNNSELINEARKIADEKTMATLAQVSAGRTDQRSMAAFTTGDGKVWTMDEWRKAQAQKQNQANPVGNTQLSPQQIKQNRELVRMLALGHAAKEMRKESGGHITTVAERNARLGWGGSNGFVGYNGNISSFQGYSTPINQFAGAKGVSPALDLVRGEDGLLYDKSGNRADARNMFVGGRPGKRMEPLGSLKRNEKGRLSGVSNAASGMEGSQKAHKNEWKGVSSGHENSPGVAAQGAGGGSGGGGNLSGKVSGSVELNINPEIFKETVAPIVMDVILDNVNKISTLLMG